MTKPKFVRAVRIIGVGKPGGKPEIKEVVVPLRDEQDAIAIMRRRFDTITTMPDTLPA